MNNQNENHRLDSLEAEEEKPKKRFRLFGRGYDVDGPGVDKDEPKAIENPTLFNFFKLLGRKLGKIVSVNALFIFGNFPILFFIIQMSSYLRNEFIANTSSMFPVIYGASLFEPDSPVLSSMLGIYGGVTPGYAHTIPSMILFVLSFLVIFTFGPVNAGATYILRNMVREEPVFLISDFKYAIKRNFKQAIPIGIFDIAVIGILIYDIMWFNTNAQVSSNGLIVPMLVVSWAALILYFFMRLYIYLMIVTFDLKFSKLIKNALFFAILGFKRNIMVLIGTLIITVLTLALCILFLPIGIIIPFTVFFGFLGFMGTYAAYPKIKQIMIDPYYAEHPEESPPESYGEDNPEEDTL